MKFEDILRLYRRIEQLLVVFWGYDTCLIAGLIPSRPD